MDCQQCHEELLDYYRGILEPSESAAIETHLKQCSDCAELVRKAGLLPELLSCDGQAPQRAVDAVLAMVREHLAQMRAQAAPAQPADGQDKTLVFWWGGIKTWFERMTARPAGLAWAATTALLLVGSALTLIQLHPTSSDTRVAIHSRQFDQPMTPGSIELAQISAPALGEMEKLAQNKALARESVRRDYLPLRRIAILGGGTTLNYGKFQGLLAVMASATTQTTRKTADIKGLLVILDTETGLCVGPSDLGELLLLRRIIVDRSRIDLAKDCLLLARSLKATAPQGLQYYWVPGVFDTALVGSFEAIGLAEPAPTRHQETAWAVGLKDSADDVPWIINETELKTTDEGNLAFADPNAPIKWPANTVLLNDDGEAFGWLNKDAMNRINIVSARELAKTLDDGSRDAREALKSLAMRLIRSDGRSTTQTAQVQLPGTESQRINVILTPDGYHLSLEGQTADAEAMLLQSSRPGIVTFAPTDRH